MKTYNHNFNDGDIVHDTEYKETFVFTDRADGYRAQVTSYFRIATLEEIELLNNSQTEALEIKPN